MANKRRIPGTRKTNGSIPYVELLEIQCTAISIVRDASGTIIGKGMGGMREVHSVEEFAEYFAGVKAEEMEARKLPPPTKQEETDGVVTLVPIDSPR